MATWTIKGEAGAGLNATERTVQELGLTQGILETGSLTDDVFTFTYKTTSAAGAGIDGVVRIPTVGQDIELFCDGTRRFKGQAMLPEVKLGEVTVQVMGPWYWMRKLPILSAQDGAVDGDTAADGTRPTIVFPTPTQIAENNKGLRECLRLLINAARDAGVPVQNIGAGEVADFIDAMFTVCKTTISSGTWADGLIELMKWCLDAVCWWDYTSTTPKIRITRRGEMTAKTLTVGTDILEGMRIKPRLDLVIDRVDIHYMTRHPVKGTPRYAMQTSGGTPGAGRLQIVPASGPDLADLVPPDDIESAEMRTRGTWEPNDDYVAKRAGAISSMISSNGKFGGVGRYVTGYTGTSWEVAKFIGIDFGALRVLKPDGTKAATTGKYLLLSPDVPEWFSKAPIRAKKVKITGTWTGTWSWGPTYSVTAAPPAGWMAWFNAAPKSGKWWLYEKLGSSSEAVNKHWFAYPFECEGTLVSVSHTTKTTVYKPWQWDYLDLPANMAENLQACQAWTPWEGTIPTIEEVTGANLMQYKINVANSASGHSTMGALLKSVRQDILNNRIEYNLGPPPVVDYRARIGMLMSQRIDRVKYL